MKEPARIRFDFDNNLWVVEVFSAAIKRWVVMGEHSTLKAAEHDLYDWI